MKKTTPKTSWPATKEKNYKIMSHYFTENKGNNDSEKITGHATTKGMAHFFCAGNAEVESQNIDYGFTSAGHDTGNSAGVTVRTGNFHNVLHYQR